MIQAIMSISEPGSEQKTGSLRSSDFDAETLSRDRVHNAPSGTLQFQ